VKKGPDLAGKNHRIQFLTTSFRPLHINDGQTEIRFEKRKHSYIAGISLPHYLPNIGISDDLTRNILVIKKALPNFVQI